MPELLIPDTSERQQALDITQSFIVEAPAGSGKTGLIIQRYLKLLASDNVTDPAQILAITFTRKATAELQERILHQLVAADAGLPPVKAFDVETRPYAEAVLARDRALGWRLIESPRSLRIRTIDSVSAEIARGLPVLSGAGGALSPSDDAGTLHADAAHRTLMLLGGIDLSLSAALEDLLLHRDGNLADAESLLANMLATRDQWGELVPLTPHHLTEHYLETVILPKLEKALEQAICRALTRLTQLVPAGILGRLSTLAAEMAQAEGYKGAPSPIEVCKTRYASPQDRAEDLDHWRALIHLLVKPSKPRDWRKSLSGNHIGFEILKNHQAELKQIIAEVTNIPNLVDELCAIDALPPAQYPPEQWRITKSLFRILSRALLELQLVFAEQGQCDFAELGLLAREALSQETALDDLRTAAGMSLQHLLVDEMQDTSTAQYELIQLLTQHWDGRSQTLFLVGDPKQSIYLFRQANVERFLHTQHHARLGDIPLVPLHLTANFRSQATLVRAFNQDFTQIFPPPTDRTTSKPGAPGLASETWVPTSAQIPGTTTLPGAPSFPESHPGKGGVSSEARPPATNSQVPYRPAIAMRPATPATRVWHAQAQPCLNNPQAQSLLNQAVSRTHADLITTITRTQTPTTTIAVLVRGRYHLLDIVKAFRAAKIPYRAVEIEPLAERQEILDLLTLTRALLHPADRTAWLALLRAPWCGLTLPDLHLLAGQDDPTHSKTSIIDLIQTRGDLLSPDGIARLEPTWSVMSAALLKSNSLPLSQLVERTWRAFAAPQVLDPEALTNTDRYFDLLHFLEQQPGPLDLDKLHTRLDKLYASPATHPGAVDLMTIHKSKGLEWDVVFVPALEKTGGKDSGTLLSWLEIDPGQAEDVAHGILAPIQARGEATTQLFAWMRGIQSAREAAERKRLFYVACTRAREELHLFAAPTLSSKGELKPKTDSLLHAAWPAAEAHIQPAADPHTQPAAEPNIALPNQAEIIPFPTPTILDSLAAGAVLGFPTPGVPHDIAESQTKGIVGAISPPRQVDRIPLHLLPTPQPQAESPATPPPFTRPQGNFAARAFGNAVHTFLDLLAIRIAQGQSPASLAAETETWSPRITAVLRSNGLGATHLQRYIASLQRALANTLADPEGLWLLAPHPEASSETSLTTREGTLRLDRTFLAGPTPGTQGNTHLWIIDYKTATHAQSGLEAFLAEEKAKYEPQLSTYAQALSHRGLPIRCVLYYPLLPKLLWWPLDAVSCELK